MAVGLIKRSITKAKLNLGIVVPGSEKSDVVGFERVKKVRSDKLEVLNKYSESKQYDHLTNWDLNCDAQDNYIAIRKRKPKIIYPFTKVLSERVATKLVGKSNFPQYKVEDDPDTEAFFKAIIKASKLKSNLVDPIKSMNTLGSTFVRFYLNEGNIKMDWYNSNHCYPEFLPNGDLSSVKVRFVFESPNESDMSGKRVQRWFQLILGMQSDISYDNPKYTENVEPIFTETGRVDHNLGFVQGEWFKTSKTNLSPDGHSLVEDVLDFIDELNYNMSQSSQSVSYNQDPQLYFSGIDEEETEALIRSSSKSWNLGREGTAGFLETDLNGVKVATELRDKVRLGIQDISRVILMDPEKVVGHAQSAKAMEVLHGPLVDLIEELRPNVEEHITKLIQKMSLVVLLQARFGQPVPFELPPNYQPSTLQPEVIWPPIFAQTIQDLRDKVQVAVSASSASLISRETLTQWLAEDFGIENVEEEVARVNAQPVLNPFGSF